MFELIYTATPKGLLQGRSGFSTVAMTQGFPPNLIPAIENLSGFRSLYMPGDVNAARNPANCTFQELHFGSSKLYLASRIEYAGLSYTGRSNTLAHHYIFRSDDPLLRQYAPAAFLQVKENFPAWQGDPRLLPEKTELQTIRLPHDCAMWKKLTGSADWGVIIARMVRQKLAPSIVLQFSPLEFGADDLLSLFAEVSAQLTPDEYGDFTFSTYCYQSAIGNPLFLRAYPERSALLESVKWMNQETILTLGKNNAIPDRYRALLRQVLTVKPQMAVSAPDRQPEPPVMPGSHDVMPPEKCTKQSVPAPVPCHRSAWFAGCFFLILAVAAVLFAALRKKEEIPVHRPMPVTAVPAPVLSRPEPKADTPALPPRSIPVKPEAKAAPAMVPVKVSDAQWFEFFLALHRGERVIPLPETLKFCVLKQVVLKKQYAAPDRLAETFDVSGNAVTVFAVKINAVDPLHPVRQPDPDKVAMTLHLQSGELAVSPAEMAVEIAALVFTVGGSTMVFQNEFKETYWQLLVPYVKISRDLQQDILSLRAEIPGDPFLEQKLREGFQWRLTTDAGSDIYPLVPGKITVPQLTHLENFLQKRRKYRNACERRDAVKTVPEPELLSPAMNRILEKYLKPEELAAVERKVASSSFTDEQLADLQKMICTFIYSNRKKNWENARDTVILDFQKYAGKRRIYSDSRKKIKALTKECDNVRQEMSAAEKSVRQYAWCRAVLQSAPDAADDVLRTAVIRKYQEMMQIELVRKAEK